MRATPKSCYDTRIVKTVIAPGPIYDIPVNSTATNRISQAAQQLSCVRDPFVPGVRGGHVSWRLPNESVQGFN